MPKYRLDLDTDQGTTHQALIDSDDQLVPDDAARNHHGRRHLILRPDDPAFAALAAGDVHRFESVLLRSTEPHARRPHLTPDGVACNDHPIDREGVACKGHEVAAIESAAHFLAEVEADGRKVKEISLIELVD